MLMIPGAETDKALPTSEYGVDSLVAVELGNFGCFPRWGLKVNIFDVLQRKSVFALAEKVAEAGVMLAK